jgi:hypothetical protein
VEENSIDKMAHELMNIMPQPEKEFVQAMMGIVERHGKLANNDGKGIWVGYEEASENEVASRGIKCLNCAHYDGEGVCHIVLQTVEPEGLCRLAAIPDGIVRLNDMMS